MKQKEIVVIGGGASGLVAAVMAARNGAKVSIIEQKDRLGKKILATGNGRCNFTNERMGAEFFYGDDKKILECVLQEFGYSNTLTFFKELGVLSKSRDGYIYPISDQAASIVDVLCMELSRLGVSVFLETSVKEIKKTQHRFQIKTNKNLLQADAVILAAGGKASPVLGSDGSGYALAKTFGHSISTVVPALVQLKGKGTFFKQISGVRTQAKITMVIDGAEAASDTGELQLTNYGISGIPVFQVSRLAAKALKDKKKVKAEIDFFPHMTDEEYLEYIECRKEDHGYRAAAEFFVGMFPQKLIPMFLKISRMDPKTPFQNMDRSQLELFVKVTKHFFVEIEDTMGFDQAQVCAGGVRTNEIHSTMESKKVSDLYLTGELLDIDGICGGYNLQWAWASGYIAGVHAAKGNKHDSNRTD